MIPVSCLGHFFLYNLSLPVCTVLTFMASLGDSTFETDSFFSADFSHLFRLFRGLSEISYVTWVYVRIQFLKDCYSCICYITYFYRKNPSSASCSAMTGSAATMLLHSLHVV